VIELPTPAYQSVSGGARQYRLASHPEIRVVATDLGLACCAVEFAAALTRGLLLPVADADPVPTLHLLVVSGTLTHALRPSIEAAWERLPEPRAAMAFGACTASGGPYWDSYSVAQGIDETIPVQVYVPGCPPRPEALIAAILSIAEGAADVIRS
jgi:NADH-quinone oxidoreductase subunit B